MTGTPYLNQPHVHDILRRWRKVADEYADSEQGPPVFVPEAWVTPATQLAQYIRSYELQTTFNFDALLCEWTAASQRKRSLPRISGSRYGRICLNSPRRIFS
jgi:alpha-glucosidase